MNHPLNPYEPTTSELTSDTDRFLVGNFQWEGRMISVSVEQTAFSLWQAAMILVSVDEQKIERFAKWRWNKTCVWEFDHHGRTVAATLLCSGAKRLHCQLLMDGIPIGEAMVPSRRFWQGLAVTSLITFAIVWVLRHSVVK